MSPRHDVLKLWSAFLRNHREVITAMDFFTVPTVRFHIGLEDVGDLKADLEAGFARLVAAG